eukprot:CAMPEP_0169431590 /NCGR_PEP_ID=MMETSP1042-20121227/3032_1 /TAXON_ID=464988 /ORGANISM="Hemiselmis andersenii, Strain CCMP1180" /LENGTH=185 /DNA_ID=CAMNT_0009542019 /DNA_START=159 /DNA_END=717 /DNA_ORIENTATION=-
MSQHGEGEEVLVQGATRQDISPSSQRGMSSGETQHFEPGGVAATKEGQGREGLEGGLGTGNAQPEKDLLKSEPQFRGPPPASRNFETFRECEDFIKRVRKGEASAKFVKEFPYRRGGGTEWWRERCGSATPKRQMAGLSYTSATLKGTGGTGEKAREAACELDQAGQPQVHHPAPHAGPREDVVL